MLKIKKKQNIWLLNFLLLLPEDLLVMTSVDFSSPEIWTCSITSEPQERPTSFISRALFFDDIIENFSKQHLIGHVTGYHISKECHWGSLNSSTLFRRYQLKQTIIDYDLTMMLFFVRKRLNAISMVFQLYTGKLWTLFYFKFTF